jgi:hypothetical protein
LSPWDIAWIKNLGSDDQAACDTTIMLPEGGGDGDAWRQAYRDKFGVRVGDRIHRRTVSEEVRRFFWFLSGTPYGTQEPDWKLAEKNWRPATSDWLLIRPKWNARALWPHCFPEAAKVPEEHERRVAEFQERRKKMAKSRSNQKRADENANVSQAFEQRAIEAQRQRYK